MPNEKVALSGGRYDDHMQSPLIQKNGAARWIREERR
jgi:hypothetical protein